MIFFFFVAGSFYILPFHDTLHAPHDAALLFIIFSCLPVLPCRLPLSGVQKIIISVCHFFSAFLSFRGASMDSLLMPKDSLPLHFQTYFRTSSSLPSRDELRMIRYSPLNRFLFAEWYVITEALFATTSWSSLGLRGGAPALPLSLSAFQHFSALPITSAARRFGHIYFVMILFSAHRYRRTRRDRRRHIALSLLPWFCWVYRF